MNTRLSDGLWVLGNRGDLHLGLLDGSMEQGWNTVYARVSASSLSDLVNCLNTDGHFAEGPLSVDVVTGHALVTVASASTRSLDEGIAARLQLVATLLDRAMTRPDVQFDPPVEVRGARGMLTVTAPSTISVPLAQGRLHAAGPAAVWLHVPTTTGPHDVVLPGLDTLVAASEALRDGQPLLVRLPAPGGQLVTVRVDARPALHAAADAQWLLPGFQRHLPT